MVGDSVPHPLSPPPDIAMPKDLFALSQLGWSRDAPGTWWIEARDAAEHPVMYRVVATTKNSLSQSIKRAEVEKP